MKIPLFFILMLLLASAQAGEVRVAVASNFLATLQALTPVYEKQTGDKLLISSASTAKLYAQIINAAPFDVFLSADRHHPNLLVKLNKAVAQSRRVYATGRLVLWSRQPRGLDQNSLENFDSGRLAIANPRTAPYGVAALQMLQKQAAWSSLKNKLVYGESIGQAFQFVASGNATLGLVALAQVLNPNHSFNQRDYWLVPQEDYAPLQQEAVLLHRSRNNAAAQRFLAFITSDQAREVITRYGYL